MLLSRLSSHAAGRADPQITGLSADSRLIEAGWLFAALPGARQDGRDYIEDAVLNGAVAVLVPRGTNVKHAVAVIESDQPQRDFSLMAARFYARQPQHIVAVTGTNGKTSTVHFTQQLWSASGLQAASLGTLGLKGQVVQSGSMTTPDAVTLHRTLADLSDAGVSHLAMEASSHGLQQCRLDGVRVQAAGFTNLTRDHLDYHPDMEHYFNAKARLFTDIVQPGGVAVLNADIAEFSRLHHICTARNIAVRGYGAQGQELRLHKRRALPQGQEIVIEVMGRRVQLVLPLVGSFMAMNALCALGLAMAATDSAIDPYLLERIQGAPGRLQLVSTQQGRGAVYVDYAHTPDALQNILAALRPHTEGRLICVFGCGGDRDPGKRPIMGRIAAEMADIAIVTDDNPRSENAAAIRQAVRGGTTAKIEDIPGRREAIRRAIEQMQAGDVLVIAGKGHEQGQIFADHVEPFDDVDEARHMIEELKGTV